MRLKLPLREGVLPIRRRSSNQQRPQQHLIQRRLTVRPEPGFRGQDELLEHWQRQRAQEFGVQVEQVFCVEEGVRVFAAE